VCSCSESTSANDVVKPCSEQDNKSFAPSEAPKMDVESPLFIALFTQQAESSGAAGWQDISSGGSGRVVAAKAAWQWQHLCYHARERDSVITFLEGKKEVK
jgi:hypothetical protein